MTELQEHLFRNTEVTAMGHTLTVAACDTNTHVLWQLAEPRPRTT